MAMKFPQYLIAKDRTIRVVGMIDRNLKEESKTEEEKTEQEKIDEQIHDIVVKKDNFEDGRGYIDEEEYIWIFNKSGKPVNANVYPYFWINDDGEKVFSHPDEETMKAFSIKNMKDMDLETIRITTRPDEVLFDEKELMDMNAASSKFIPIISEDDDFLKKTVKKTIIEKNIDINKLKGRTDEKYMLPNMRAALANSTKMSVTYFLYWMKLLGCDFEITVMDDGTDTVDPLKNDVVYQSYKDNVGVVCNNEVVFNNNYITINEDNDDDD